MPEDIRDGVNYGTCHVCLVDAPLRDFYFVGAEPDWPHWPIVQCADALACAQRQLTGTFAREGGEWVTCRRQVAGWWRGWRLAGAYKRFERGR